MPRSRCWFRWTRTDPARSRRSPPSMPRQRGPFSIWERRAMGCCSPIWLRVAGPSTGPRSALTVPLSSELRKDFGTTSQFADIMNELAGGDGPFRDFALVRTKGFARVDYELTGVIDTTGDLSSFGDPDLEQALDRTLLGHRRAVRGDRGRCHLLGGGEHARRATGRAAERCARHTRQCRGSPVASQSG